MPRVSIEDARCKGCELCVNACPQQVLKMSTTINEKGYFFAQVKDPGRCIGCLVCAVTCPDVAITVQGTAVQYRLFEYFPAQAVPSGHQEGEAPRGGGAV